MARHWARGTEPGDRTMELMLRHYRLAAHQLHHSLRPSTDTGDEQCSLPSTTRHQCVWRGLRPCVPRRDWKSSPKGAAAIRPSGPRLTRTVETFFDWDQRCRLRWLRALATTFVITRSPSRCSHRGRRLQPGRSGDPMVGTQPQPVGRGRHEGRRPVQCAWPWRGGGGDAQDRSPWGRDSELSFDRKRGLAR